MAPVGGPVLRVPQYQVIIQAYHYITLSHVFPLAFLIYRKKSTFPVSSWRAGLVMGCPYAIACISLLWVLFDCWRGQGYRLDCSAPPIQSTNNGTCAHFKSYEFRDYGTDEVRYKEESGQQSPGAHLADASKVVFSFRWLKMICHDYHHTYAIFLARIHKSSKERKICIDCTNLPFMRIKWREKCKDKNVNY